MRIKALMATVAILVAAAGLLLLRRPHSTVLAPATAVAPAAGPATTPAADEPVFRTPEQAARYYSAVTTGEKRALGVVEEALRKARAGGDRSQVGKLEALRREYLERIKRHEGRKEAGLQDGRPDSERPAPADRGLSPRLN